MSPQGHRTWIHTDSLAPEPRPLTIISDFKRCGLGWGWGQQGDCPIAPLFGALAEQCALVRDGMGVIYAFVLYSGRKARRGAGETRHKCLFRQMDL